MGERNKRLYPNANSAGHALHRWTAEDGTEWACAAYDHGPMCRLCQPVTTEVLDQLLDHVADGNLEVLAESDGQFRFRFTPKGTAAADQIAARYGIPLPPRSEMGDSDAGHPAP